MPKSNRIYLDYAASAGPNPSSIHQLGVEANKKLQMAREEVASVLRARPEEIIFTGGGTESNNLAIQGFVYAVLAQNFFGSSVLLARPLSGSARPLKNSLPIPHLVTTNIEHPSVLETCRLLEKRKLAEVSFVPVESNGIIDPRKIKKAIRSNTVLVSVMYANNEIGTIQPIREIAKEIRHHNKMNSKKILFHTDAVQAANYLDLNVEKLGVDLLSLSGSKIGGAGRVGVLFKKKSVQLERIFGGGSQEFGLRPGTENLPEIVKFASAFKQAQKNKEKESKRLEKLRNYFINSLIRANKEIIINGDLKGRLPNNINITFPKIPGDLLVIELSARGVMVSSKSACESSKAGGSHVIKAIHPEFNSEIGGLRFSMGEGTTKKNIDYTVKSLLGVLQKLKKWYTPTPILKLK